MFLIGFVLGPMFERALRNTVNLFDDPWHLAVQHALLPALALLAVSIVWRGAVAQRRAAVAAGSVCARLGDSYGSLLESTSGGRWPAERPTGKIRAKGINERAATDICVLRSAIRPDTRADVIARARTA